MRKYVDDHEVGLWNIYEFTPEAKDLHEYGKPVQRYWRLAAAMVGHRAVRR